MYPFLGVDKTAFGNSVGNIHENTDDDIENHDNYDVDMEEHSVDGTHSQDKPAVDMEQVSTHMS